MSNEACTVSYVTPCMGVWIETMLLVALPPMVKSHPVWVCGLKQSSQRPLGNDGQSHPVWVCGLKLLLTIKR